MKLPVMLAITPRGAPRMTRQDRWTDVEKDKGRPAVLKYFKYRNTLSAALPVYELPEKLCVTFYLPMSASKSNKWKAAHHYQPHDQKPDIDNLLKGFMDCFGEDKHVYAVKAEKYWADSGMIIIDAYEGPGPAKPRSGQLPVRSSRTLLSQRQSSLKL